MQAYVLFSYSNKIGSKVIRIFQKSLTKIKFIKNIPSHTSVLIGNIVYESSFEGIRATTFDSWIAHNIVVNKLPLNEVNQLHMDRIIALFGKKYDYAGLFYFAYRIILLKLLRLPLPKKNKWHRINKYFCTEVLSIFTEKDYQMKSPVQIMEGMQNDFSTSAI